MRRVERLPHEALECFGEDVEARVEQPAGGRGGGAELDVEDLDPGEVSKEGVGEGEGVFVGVEGSEEAAVPEGENFDTGEF